MKFQSLKFKIPSFFAIYLSVIILVSIFLIVDHVQENSLEEKLAKNMVMSELMSRKIGTYLDSAMDDVVTSVGYISQDELTEDKIYYEIERLFDNYGYFDLVFYMSDEGRMIYSKPYNEIAIKEKTYTDRDYYQYIMEEKEPFISRLYMSRVLDQPHFVLAAPVTGRDGLEGLLAAGIPLKEMKDEIGKLDSSFVGGIWVVDSYGSIIVNPYEDLMDDEITTMEHVIIEVDGQESDMYDFLSTGRGGSGIVTRDGNTFYVAATFVEGANLAVLVEQEEAILYREAYEVVNDMKFIALIIIALGFVLGFILSRGITKPLNRLVDSVRTWSSGGKMDVERDRKDEIGELASTFEEMAINLDQKVEDLMRDDRLSIIGEFSSSIIHDIGNPLAGLNNLLDLYRSDMTDEAEKEEILGLIEEEIAELNEIVLNFLNFIRSNESKERNIDVNHLVQEAVNIMRAEMINRDIKVRFSSDSDHIYADIDRRNFKQAIINILKNAVQAIGEKGHIDIAIVRGQLETRIRIRDDGTGMKEDEMDRIFEPFYTTKKDGTGLGLSSAYKTVRDNNCRIEVSSEYGQGTEFVIAIPKEEE